jgi:ribosome biogenesis GTPase
MAQEAAPAVGLEELGWDGWFARRRDELAVPGPPGRVSRLDRGWSTVWTGEGACRARSAGLDVAVGDWVVLDDERVAAVLERRGAFVRRATKPGAEPQVVVANVDMALLLHALSRPPNRRRLERELVLAYESGASPVVVLTKADLRPSYSRATQEVHAVAPDVSVIVVSAHDGTGIDELRGLLGRGTTAAFLGASGVGKSTIVNTLVGAETQRIGDLRADRKGRHTTTAAQLLRTPDGALVVDTPGLRTLGLWTAGEGLDRAFPDVAGLAVGCRFRNCRHAAEPGCAVRGVLEPARVDAYRRLHDELDALEIELSRQRRR